MSGAEINVNLITWDEDIIEDVCRHLETANKRSAKGRAVSLLTGAFASTLFYGGGEPERLIAHCESGKPYMPGFEDLTVSISHHGSDAAVSLSPIPHGIDLEIVRPVSERLFRRVFSPEERDFCSGQFYEKQMEFFFRTWTRKEALIKTGTITLGAMHTVSVMDDTLRFDGYDYYFDTVSFDLLTPGLPDGCTMSMCSRGIPAKIVPIPVERSEQLRAASLLDRLYFN